MKDWLKKLLKAKEEARAALKEKGKNSESIEEVRSITDQVESLNEEIAEIRSQLEKLEQSEEQHREQQEEFEHEYEERGTPQGQLNPIGTFSVGSGMEQQEEKREESVKEREERGKALQEMRAVTVGSSSIVIPQHSSNEINQTFNQVSSLLDRVNIKPLMGGESYKQPYVKGYGTGDYSNEADDYNDAEPTFGYAEINKTKITAYAEDTEEITKLPAADYDREVMKGITIAARKKITREILVGTGETNRLTGIFSSKATAIDPATDLSIEKIDNNTLDEIIFSFGGDEDVEDAAVLILNKKDLKEFSKLRTNDGKKFHDIKTNGNTGTIDGIPFIINSACKAISDESTQEDDYCMAYGPLSNYMLTIFSDMDIQRSTDYKFKQGMIAHRGSVFLGGNVVSHNGFLRIKKGVPVG